MVVLVIIMECDNKDNSGALNLHSGFSSLSKNLGTEFEALNYGEEEGEMPSDIDMSGGHQWEDLASLVQRDVIMVDDGPLDSPDRVAAETAICSLFIRLVGDIVVPPEYSENICED